MGTVMLRCTTKFVGMNQNGNSTRNAGMNIRTITRMVAPLPVRSSMTQSFIEAGSRPP